MLNSGSGEWYVVHVYTQKEKWVTTALKENGHDALLLLYTVVQQWSDRRMQIDRAVFPGYIFCRFDPREQGSILATPGVMRILGVGRKPAPVEPHEIAALLRIAETGHCVTPVPYLMRGEAVTIRGGALDGVTGRLAAFRRGLRVIVSVSLLERAVSLEVDVSRIEPLRSKGPRPNACTPDTPALAETFPADAEHFLPVKRYKPLNSPDQGRRQGADRIATYSG